MDQLEAMPPLKSNDVQGFEKFADLVRISVVKLQADGRDGELGEGTLHGLFVRKLGERQVESYSRWLKENKKERWVVNFNEWLKEEVRVRVEAKEMVHGLEVESRQDENLEQSTGMVIEEGFIHFTLVVLWVVAKKPNHLVGSVKVIMVYGLAKGFRG